MERRGSHLLRWAGAPTLILPAVARGLHLLTNDQAREECDQQLQEHDDYEICIHRVLTFFYL